MADENTVRTTPRPKSGTTVSSSYHYWKERLEKGSEEFARKLQDPDKPTGR